jgi:hypothetical protein
VSLWRRKRGKTFSVVGLAVDDGSTFVPAMTMTGDVRHLLAGEDRPFPGSVLYVIGGASGPDVATHRAVEHFEARAVADGDFWEKGEVYFL